MTHCQGCGHWVCERRREYGDGSVQVYYSAPEGKGHCEVLDLDTVPEFGCLSFMAGDHVRTETIEGAPWERWEFIPCPDCDGRGCTFPDGRACRRCSGTAKVRRYDDGYVADATWDHPKEKERKKNPAINVVDPGTVLSPVRSSREGILS